MPFAGAEGCDSHALGNLSPAYRDAGRFCPGAQSSGAWGGANHHEAGGDNLLSFEITEPVVEQYIYDILPERDAVLQEVEQQAKERDIPIVGPAVGRVLYQYARLIDARRVF